MSSPLSRVSFITLRNMQTINTRNAYKFAAEAAAAAAVRIYENEVSTGQKSFTSKASVINYIEANWDRTIDDALTALMGMPGMASPDTCFKANNIPAPRSILGTSSKMTKTDRASPVMARVSYLAPADMLPRTLGILGDATACAMAFLARCSEPCLGGDDGSGHLAMPNGSARLAQLGRTMLLLGDPIAFAHLLLQDLRSLARASEKKGVQGVARLDGTSDLGMGRMIEPVLQGLKLARFDYTKTGRALKDLERTVFSGWNHPTGIKVAGKVLGRGGRVALVFATRDIARAMAAAERLCSAHGWTATVVDGDRAEPVDACTGPEVRVLTLKATAATSFERSAASPFVFPA